MSTTTLAAAATTSLSGPGAVGLSLGGVALLAGLAIAMHHKKKSPRIIGWLCFAIGIPLADLFSGILASIAGLSLWAIPVLTIMTGYVGFVFFHDGFKKRGGGGGSRGAVALYGSSGSTGGGAHRWMQPIFGLILPALLLTLGGSLGAGIHTVLNDVNGGVGGVVHNTTGS
jgi:hypothetical protein